mmetsp:Transcript_32176/g.42428  ORF Transcript_32176/g.42428 Transcript_32176/m.42428 type:complete len:281 (+) Transcript_32176:111-953(+)|eukprot:CAMPEP_0117735654 /NCGR_PEP_ID=MMETSP0947-20121206/1445_1 /TAXON_ID=44440 /ORGANISM="Chattonella subsalsa, Strain CCMP2191" /LENGTH=280 /DNA_ID=CAMNT_0005550759 /DNA_START=91 /DNA_END=933 /DNA_ORIENTATION=-
MLRRNELYDDRMSSMTAGNSAFLEIDDNEGEEKNELDCCLSFFGVRAEGCQFGECSLQIHCLERIPGAMALQPDTDLTGLKIWPGADMICRYLYSHKDELKGKSVLELGAGVGLNGLLAAALGSRPVVLTDINELSLRCLEKNVQANFPQNSVDVHFSRLEWGTTCKDDHLVEESSSKGFDLIIGSEVAYSVQSVSPLIQTIERYLSKAEDAVCVLSHASRFEAVEEELQSVLQIYGLVVTETMTTLEIPCDPWLQIHEGCEGTSVLIIKRSEVCPGKSI